MDNLWIPLLPFVVFFAWLLFFRAKDNRRFGTEKSK